MSTGAWRWAALGFGLLALATARLALIYPAKAGFAGYALLGGIGAVAALLALCGLAARWRRASRMRKRVAEAAGPRQCRLGDHRRPMARCWTAIRSIAAWRARAKAKAPPPPELALAGEPSSAVLYRLSRDAAEGQAREESFQVMPGLEIVAAVRPLPDKQTVWWFTPRLSASVSPIQPQPARARARRSRPNRVAAAMARAAKRAPISAAMSAICSATRPWAWPLPTRMA